MVHSIRGSRIFRRVRRLFRSTGLLGLVFIGCLFLGPVAQAGWLPPVDISEAGRPIGSPNVVLDSQGNATAVWDRWISDSWSGTVVESAYRPAGEGWQAPVTISGPEDEGAPGANNAISPQVVVDRNGNVTVIWERYTGTSIVLQSVDRPEGGDWTEPVDIGEVSLGSAPEPWIATDWEGNETAVWKDDETIVSSFRPFAGEWETPIPLASGYNWVPRAAMDARGDATVVWMHFDGSRYVIEGAYRPEGGEWESPTLVSQPKEAGGNPYVAIDAEGDALVAWRSAPGKGESEGDEAVRAAYRPAGGSWGSPVSVSSPGEEVQSLRDAVDPDGNALVAWTGSEGKAGEYDIAKAAYRPAGGSWEAPVPLSEDGGNAYPLDLVFDTSGNAALAWERDNGTDNVVQAAYRPAEGDWEAATDLSEEGTDAMDASLVLDAPGDEAAADGDATAVWRTVETVPCEISSVGCPSVTVQAAGFDAVAPPAERIEVPESGTVGEPVEVSIPPEDIWSPEFDFGDGAKVAATSATHVYEEKGEFEVSFASTNVLGYPTVAHRTIEIVPAAEMPEGESPAGASQPPPGPRVESAPSSGPAESMGADSDPCRRAHAAHGRAVAQLRRTRARLAAVSSPGRAAALHRLVRVRLSVVRRTGLLAREACGAS